MLSLQSSSLGTEKTYERVNNMRKLSIKTLSLVLCLLLAIPVLFALPFSAKAEAEVTPGDLNGDSLVDQSDIELLEAVLAGTQEVNMTYDISGNRMVGSEDLVVLKNLVDPTNNPALPDKLADGTTDDLLVGAACTGVQGAVVRGDSTRAAGANGKAVKVLFAEPQDWSLKKILKADALWVDCEEFGFTLLDMDGKAIGAETKVTCETAEWSAIEIPLNGTTSRARVAVGGFMISVEAGAQVYLDNLSLVDMEATDMSTVTREDMEKALVEVAWNYYLKKGKVQYDSVEFNTSGSAGSNSPLSKDYGSAWRTNPFSTLEDATSDSNIYSVCSDYCWSVYNEALGYPILGNRVNAVTPGLFINTQYPQDMAVLRWWDSGLSKNDLSRLQTHNNGVAPVQTHSAEKAIEFFTNWETNLRPGDIIVMHGNGGHQHAMLYVGNGQILHCGGGKFDMETGKDDTEPNGAIHLTSIEGTFFGYDQDGYFNLNNSGELGPIADTNTYGAWLVVVRPLDVLTMDNGNGTDVLDLTYELNTGLMQYELANNTQRPVKTSDYEGVTAVTNTRLQYPGMDIDRTVSVKNYGTVAKDGQLTYTITITNNSGDEKYITSYGKESNYAGQTYTGLVVKETVPANTTYVSNVGGGTHADGSITWNLADIPAGSSVTVSYIVAATGNLGDKIVCGNGTVANIPSNVLTTTIGGEKLANASDAFINADVSEWNDGNGEYQISANPADGTDFAERVYNEMTGLNLQLPTVQELASNFFTQEELYQPYGLHQSHSKSITRYMYTLNTRSEMAEGYQVYRDMLVEGYFGGIWVYSNDYNNEPRIIDPNVRYLETGDILVYMNLTGSVSGGLKYEERTVRSWRVLVYLGNNTFASLDSNRQMLKAPASAAVSALTYDMFLVLRPSQAYDNLNTEIGAFGGSDQTWTDADNTYVYAPPATSELLNAENQDRIAALTVKDSEGVDLWSASNLSFATQVYRKIGIDIKPDGFKGAAFSTLFTQNVFVSDKSTSYKYALSTSYPLGYEELHTMVRYYGGTVFAAGSELTTLDDLTVGDVVILGNRDDGVSAYLCAIYQGSGKFLIGTRQYPNGDAAVPQVSTWYQKTVTDLAAWLSQPIYENSEITTTYQGYVVLRPSNAYENINALRVRDITEGKLTETEVAKLESLTVEDWLYDGRATQFNHFPSWAYERAQVDINAIIADRTVTYAQEAVFKKVAGKLVPLVPGDTGYNAEYANMLVHSCYGGAQTKNPGRLISQDELQIGDIFVAAKVNTDLSISGDYVYRVALYQGGTKFLISDVISGGEGGTAWVSESEIIGEDYSTWLYYFVLRPEQVVYTDNDLWSICLEGISVIAGEAKNLTLVTAPATYQPSSITWESSDNSVATVDANGKVTAHRIGECTITATCGGLTASCTVKVPMRSITTGILTAEEMDILKSYSTDTSALARVLAVNAYAAADIDISTLFSGLSFFDIQEKILDGNGDLLASTASGYDANFAKMLVPGYYGGGYNATKSAAPTGKTFEPADFKVGDLFLAVCEDACEHSKKWTYITGLYIGEGKFLMMRHNSGCSESTCRTVTIDEYNVTANSAVWGDLDSLNAYRFYFVLRPERLAARSITSGALTPEEMAAFDVFTIGTKTLAYVADDAYATVGISGIRGLMGSRTAKTMAQALFTGSALTEVTDTNKDFHAMLMPDYYGGSKFITGNTFNPEDLKPGDVFGGLSEVACDHNGWNYVTAIYLGDETFYVISQNCATCNGYLDKKDNAITTDATKGFSTVSLWTEDAAELESVYSYYYVLRPERLAPVSLEEAEVALYRNEEATLNIAVKPDTYNSLTWTSSNEEVATVDASGNVTGKSAGTAVITVNCDGYKASCVVTVSEDRLITSGALTADEMAAIQTYEPEATYTVGPFIKHAYELANIDLTSAVGTDSFFDMQAKLFDTNTGLPLDTQDATYAKMLLPGYYGGKRYSANSGEDGRTFIPADFKVGDTFIAAQDAACAVGGSRWVYVTGVYIGNGQFYIAENHSHTDGAACNRVYISDYNTDNAEKSIVWGDAAAMKLYRYYFVLRPERLASDALQSISLTGTTLEKNATTTLVVTKDPEGAAPDATVTWRSSDETVATVDANGVVTGVKVGTATITAYCDGYSASCEVNVTARNITSGALTAEELAAIANYETEETVFWYTLTSSVYNRAGIYVEAFDTNISFNTLRTNVFSTTESDYTKMLMPGYYGGSKKATGKTFVPADLKIGDIIATATAKCANGSWTYLTGIYQGEGKFFVSKRCCNQEGCSLVYEDIYGAELTDGKLANGMTSFWSTAAQLEAAYEYYFVLRPERLASNAIQSISLNENELTLNFSDANSLPAANAATLSYETVPAVAAAPASVTWSTSNPDVATVDQNGNITAVGAGTCTITVNCDGYTATCQVTVSRTADARGSLTATEQAALQAFTGEGNTVFADFAKSAYTAAGIDISPVFAKYGFYDLARKNFDVDGGTYDLLAADALTEEQAKFRKMLMFDYYGGSKIAVGKTFTPENFEIGDLFFAVRKCPTTEAGGLYIAGIYQGDGNFLIYEHHPTGCGGTCRSLFTDEYNVTEETVVWGTSAEMKTIQYYFVLRPSRLAMRHISDGALTATEQETLTNYSREEMGGTLSQVAIDAYTQAGIVVDFVFEKASISTARTALLNDSTGALIEGDTVWHKMLVAGSNGGSANAESTKTFTTAEFQVGDLFCAIGQCEHGKWPAVTAVYLGNGKFQVSSHASCDCLASYVDDIANVDETGVLTTNGRVSIWATDVEALNSVWKHYFVLRPSQLAE